MTVRSPAVRGLFYADDPAVLAADVDRFVDRFIARAPAPGAQPPKAVIAPHAGYEYSGPIAGSAYAALAARAQEIRRVVLLGPAHRAGLRGIAASDADAFRTPLGDVAVDRDALAAALDSGLVHRDERAHRGEHSLEVQLPFLQRVLPGARALPMAVGHAADDEVARLLDALWGGAETALVVSSDLSHYLTYEEARAADARTAAAIAALDAEAVSEDDACGAVPIRGLLLAARRHGLTARAVDLRSSGDTAGDRESVVGYGAFVFSAPRS